MATLKPIHTLEARGNIMFEVMRDVFNLDSMGMFALIQGQRSKVEAALKHKRIDYTNLKSALVPSNKRREVALVFDTEKIASGWYGGDVMERLIPLLNMESNHSVMEGDYLDRPGQDDDLFSAFQQAVQLRNQINYRHPTQFYIVYLNNLSDEMIRRIDEGLSSYIGYAGMADTTYTSAFKVFLSTMLVNSFIKHGKIILQAHAPDCDPDENINTKGYAFEKNGFICRSICSDLFDTLLSYKIERPIFPGFESDTEISLNAISLTPANLEDFEVDVAIAKLEYLKREKGGSIERLGLKSITAEQLAALIRSKISSSYVYNLVFDQEHDVAKFNVIIEIPPNETKRGTRLLAALEYQPISKLLRLITLY